MHTMRYVGLPNVMQIDLLVPNIGSMFSAGMVVTPDGHYFISVDNIYLFDGSKPRPIGFEVCEQFFAEVSTAVLNPRFDWTFGKYDAKRSEVIWTYWINGANAYQCKQMVYQVDFKRFYFRHLPSDDTTANTNIRAFTPNPIAEVRGSFIYGGYQVLLQDWTLDRTDYENIVPDHVDNIFTLPVAETPDLSYGDLYGVKEHSSLILDASFTYGTGFTVEHSARTLVSALPTFETLAQTWTPTLPERLLSFPHKSGIVFRYRFTGSGAGSYQPAEGGQSFSPITGLKLFGYADFLYTNGAEQ
jgi:hypothetical protein